MGLLSFVIWLGCIVMSASCRSHYGTISVRRALASGLLSGKSLNGTTLQRLKPSDKVAAAGDVENYSKFPLIVEVGEAAAGVITTKLRNVAGSHMEAFASRKLRGTATGTWIRYTLSIKNEILLHVMYSVPFNHHWHDNWLAVAMCLKKDKVCSSLNARKMYYDSFPFLVREKYTKPVKICFALVCVKGSIDFTYQPDIDIEIFPKKYWDLDHQVRLAAMKNLIDQKKYHNFLKKEFYGLIW